MLSDFDIAMSASLTALTISMGQFMAAATALGLSFFILGPGEGWP